MMRPMADMKPMADETASSRQDQQLAMRLSTLRVDFIVVLPTVRWKRDVEILFLGLSFIYEATKPRQSQRWNQGMWNAKTKPTHKQNPATQFRKLGTPRQKIKAAAPGPHSRSISSEFGTRGTDLQFLSEAHSGSVCRT